VLAGVASIAAVTLAAVLLWSAAAKARAHHTTVAGFAELGLPAPALLAPVVIVVELLLAVGLLVRPGWAGLAAVGVLAAFTVVLVELRQRGNLAPCHCFGARLETPVGRAELLRNAALITLAVLATQTDALTTPWS